MKRKMINLLKSEQGSGLVLSLMVLLVLSVLGAALGVVTIGSHRLGNINQDSMSAYYIAEAGANMAYEEIRAEVEDLKDSPLDVVENKINNEFVSNNKIYDNFSKQSGSTPSALIKVKQTKDEENIIEYVIESTGTISDNTRTVEKPVKINWQENSNGGFLKLPVNGSTIIKDEIKIDNGNISGDIYLDSKEKNSFEVSNAGNIALDQIYTSYPNNYKDIYTGTSNNFQQYIEKTDRMTVNLPWDKYYEAVDLIRYPNFNDYPFVPSQTVVKNESEKYEVVFNNDIRIDNYLADDFILDLSKDSQANKLIIDSDYNLKIKTNNKTVNLVVNELDLSQGSIEIIDNGTLNLYVLNIINIGGGSSINKNGNQNKFNIFYAGNDELVVSGSQHINGGIHIKNANLKLTAGGNVSGPVLSNGKIVTIDGGSLNNILLFSPKANLSLSGSGTVNGVVVADTLNLSGDPSINYTEYDFNNFPNSFKMDNSNEDMNEIITTEPSIEK